MQKTFETKVKEKKSHQVNGISLYKSLFDNAADAIFIIQPKTWNVIDANDYACRLLEMNQEELKQKPLHEFASVNNLLSKAVSPFVLSEINLTSKNGSQIPFEANARYIEYRNQKLILAIARDVREQNLLTDRLVQADKLVVLGQLSAGVAHEIRNPLAAVNLNLQLLQRRIPAESPDYSYVQTALQGAERISRIVEITLNFSRPSVPEIRDMNMNMLINPTLDLVAAELRKKEIQVDVKLDNHLPLVSADSKQIQQVLINLLTNAADAVKPKGQISIKTYKEQIEHKQVEKKLAVVSVSDNGIGIIAEDLQKIFHPFFTKKTDGTGLGLPITQRIMHQHNGSIDVESQPGKGTTFYIKLPAVTNG